MLQTNSNTVKVAMMTDAWMPVWGGGQEHILQVSKILSSKYDFSIDIIVPNITDESGKEYILVEKFKEPKLRVLRIGPKFVFPSFGGRFLFIISLAWFVLRSNYDIYHSQYYGPSLVFPIVKHLKNKKFIFTLHGVGKNALGGGILNRLGLFSFFMKIVTDFKYDRFLSVAKSTFTQSEIIERNISVIENGVNIDEFDQVKSKKGKKFRIFWIGRFDEIKGLDILLKAISMVAKKHDNFEAILAGEGPEKQNIIQLRDTLKLKKYVSIRGSIYTMAKIKLFKSSNLYVLPSLSEGLPIVLLEAMAAKLPIVASDVGDISQILKNGRSGYLVNPGDVSDLASKIERSLKNKSLPAMGKDGYKIVKDHYSWNHIANRVAGIYNSVADEEK